MSVLRNTLYLQIQEKMAQVHINKVTVSNNPASILSPIQFQITFECFKDLPGLFEWKIVYLGSPTNESYDQIIDQFEMEDLKAGVLSFMTDSEAPNFSRIPTKQILGTTAIIISVCYEKQQFFRLGYYICNEYNCGEEEIPAILDFSQVTRNVMNQNPRIMRFEIEWDEKKAERIEWQNVSYREGMTDK